MQAARAAAAQARAAAPRRWRTGRRRRRGWRRCSRRRGGRPHRSTTCSATGRAVTTRPVFVARQAPMTTRVYHAVNNTDGTEAGEPSWTRYRGDTRGSAVLLPPGGGNADVADERQQPAMRRGAAAADLIGSAADASRSCSPEPVGSGARGRIRRAVLYPRTRLAGFLTWMARRWPAAAGRHMPPATASSRAPRRSRQR